ncbi:ABC transporter ATP-binding protein [Streptococcus ferus]|uniref:ABC transporter ATP-binding protein n=1 Tax=Streptococcus ferus TaxID=1345 RepID=A0A2X3W4V9_9STRE|nr:ABC transporter ATP-binding protein [Streptococcus ferus]SQF39396.1 ABC transporter ATP-binding protein [Streptococcus ferus]
MKRIVVNHLSKCFGKKEALKDISFTISEGEIFGFLGPSGSGKTTTINILTGQLAASSGEVTVFGKKPQELKTSDFEKIGIVSDNSGSYEKISLYKNILAYSKLYNLDKSRVDELLKLLGLYDDRKKPVEKLSTGMKQRMLLARALLNKPQVLFLDEPTSGLDPATSRVIHDLLLALRDAGTSIFLTTHDMHEATLLCDQLALLDKGLLVEQGSPSELITKYNHRKKVRLTYEDGSHEELDFSELTKRGDAQGIEMIHSCEPTLEDIFIELTGGKLNV